jgi:hypothetical protein
MNAVSLRYFLAQVDDTSGPGVCWQWRGVPDRDGYGTFGRRPQRRAHRVAYELAVGPIPTGLVIDHLCGNRICVNPAHMEPVTQRTNILRSPNTMPNRNAAKTRCPRGHAYSPENTYVRPTGTGRDCRTSKRLAYAQGVSA